MFLKNTVKTATDLIQKIARITKLITSFHYVQVEVTTKTIFGTQHVSIYTQTDPMEGIGCEKLKDGLIKQAELVNLILSAKKDLSLVPETLRKLNSL